MKTTVKIPRDLAAYPFFRSMVYELAGDEQAVRYLCFEFFTALGYQAETHGRSGFFSDGDAGSFDLQIRRVITFLKDVSSTTPAADAKPVPLVFTYFLKSGLIRRDGERGYLCPLFRRLNPELDANYIPANRRGQLSTAVNKIARSATRSGKEFLQKLPPEAWLRDDGTRIEETEMVKAVNLVGTLDGILDGILLGGTRSPEQFDIGILRDASRIAATFTWGHLQAIFRRLHQVRSDGDAPKSTALALRGFESMVAAIEPAEGWVEFGKLFGLDVKAAKTHQAARKGPA